MKNLRPRCLVFLTFACFAVCAAAQGTTQIKKVAPRPATSIGGKALYGEYCAACHGVDGKGNGPAADALKQRPNDLTQMSRQSKGGFPEERFLKIINGEVAYAAHGSEDMPVWGAQFRNTDPNLNTAQDRIYALLNYVESLQAK